MAVARKLAVIIHAMWRDGSEFRFKADEAAKKHRRRKAQMLVAAGA